MKNNYKYGGRMNTKISELTLAEKLLITGNILGSISMALISIGAIIRKNDLPDTPLFNNGVTDVPLSKTSVRTNQQGYWEK